MRKFSIYLLLFLLGATLGPVCDGFHTHSDTLSYPDPWIFKSATFVPFLFGSAVVLISWSHLHLDSLYGQNSPRVTVEQTLLGMGLFVAAYFSSGFLEVSEVTKFVVLGFWAYAGWRLLDGRIIGMVEALGTALFGTMVEVALVFFDVFSYHADHSQMFGVPIWLPWLYILASVGVGNLARHMHLDQKKLPI